MSSKIAITTKHLSTLIALIRFVVSVSEKVGLEIRALIELSLTNRALMWRLFHVKNLMDCQGS